MCFGFSCHDDAVRHGLNASPWQQTSLSLLTCSRRHALAHTRTRTHTQTCTRTHTHIHRHANTHIYLKLYSRTFWATLPIPLFTFLRNVRERERERERESPEKQKHSRLNRCTHFFTSYILYICDYIHVYTYMWAACGSGGRACNLVTSCKVAGSIPGSS